MKKQRPPSSYGSMKSESDDMNVEEYGATEAKEQYGGEQEEQECDQEVAEVFHRPAPILPHQAAAYDRTGVQMNRSVSPETYYTQTTQQTKPPGAIVIDTRSSDVDLSPEEDQEDEDEDEDEVLITNSPEPPEPIELENEIQMDEHGQPGRLHPEQDLPHVFKNIQKVLTDLNKEELYKFKLNFHQRQTDLTLQHLFEGDLLDFVDRIIEKFGLDCSLSNTISTLENITKHEQAEELRINCNKALIRSSLKQDINRKYQFIYEGVPRPGKRSPLDSIYVEPEISICGCGGVDPSHELRSSLQSPVQSTRADTLVSLNNLFRLKKPNDQPVRTVLTMGLPGIGMSVCEGKYCCDWAEDRANKDLQYVITLPFSSLWILRNRNISSSISMSIMDVIEYHHSLCKTKTYLDEEDCKFLIIMDSFDCYQTVLDWKNTPEIKDNHCLAKLDDLIVNLIRGSLLPNAQVWILGRPAAVSQIPSKFLDVATEIHGFSDEMKDNYFMKRCQDPEMGRRIVDHYKRQPTLRTLARQPFVCWMAARIFGHNFRNENYGGLPPKVTGFYVNTVLIQTNRRLQFYYEKSEHNLKWSSNDRQMLRNLGKMALKMLEKNTSEFVEEDTKEHHLDLTDVTVFSGLCTELPVTSSGNRRFCFIHITVQEFMAALYVFTVFRVDSKNVLSSGGLLQFFSSNQQTKLAVEVVQCAINRAFSLPRGQYDMFLRFLCGLLSPDNNNQLSSNLYDRDSVQTCGLDEVSGLLGRTLKQCPRDRVENLKECLRELTQKDD